MFRSGTTLIEQVLGSHPAITTGGELPYFARRVGADIVPYPDALAGVAPAVLQALGRGYLDYLHEAFPGAARVTDKRPDNFLYLGLIKALFPRARIVHASRNVLDNALSLWFQNLDARFNYANSLRHIVHYNAQQQRLMAHWGTLFGADILDVSYDRFVADQRAQTARLLDFCGLDWTDAALDFHAARQHGAHREPVAGAPAPLPAFLGPLASLPRRARRRTRLPARTGSRRGGRRPGLSRHFPSIHPRNSHRCTQPGVLYCPRCCSPRHCSAPAPATLPRHPMYAGS